VVAVSFAHFRVDEDARPPEPVDDVAAWNQLAPPFDEQNEQVHRAPLDPDRLAAAAESVRRDVELEISEPECGRAGAGHRCGVAMSAILSSS